tara:strand:+ start:828 stop:2342 length:1515 start_codon:yes stop_codon:yes gene_type:complete
MQGITCRFPGDVYANREIDFEVQKGEVHALLGENGAGKSTLMKIAFGMLPPTEGQIFWEETPVSFRSASDAMAHGIGMVHQHFMLIPSFTVWENIVLGHEPTHGPHIDKERAREQVKKLSDDYGLHIDPDALVEHLSVGERQRVEILKALYRQIKLLILDEPTAVLTPQEADALFLTLRQLVDEGLTIIFISHKLREVMAIADRVTILRKGQKVAEGDTKHYTLEALATQMVGRPLNPPERATPPSIGAPVLALHNVSLHDHRGLEVVKNVSLQVREHEIVGIAGVEGNGQRELIEAIVGLRPIQQGKITLHGESIDTLSTQQRLQRGLAHVPEDRQRRGLVMPYSNKENQLLGRHFEDTYKQHDLWIDDEQLTQDTKEAIKDFGIEPALVDIPVHSLSGGNQQKVVVAREFRRPAQAFLIAHPTRGVDIGAIESIHRHILSLQSQPNAILLFSSELPELIALSQRILVMYEGSFVGELDATEATETQLGILMTGGSLEAPPAA